MYLKGLPFKITEMLTSTVSTDDIGTPKSVLVDFSKLVPSKPAQNVDRIVEGQLLIDELRLTKHLTLFKRSQYFTGEV